MRVYVVAFILLLAISTNVFVNYNFPERAGHFPFIGAAVWVAIAVGAFMRRPNWKLLPRAFGGSIFLLALVMGASLMPVEQLPAASWQTAFGLGFLSAVFDNIPLTALALKQGGYDWGMLAYTVGFGGSMIWFGSSSGVALCNMYPEARSVGQWVRHGWAIRAVIRGQLLHHACSLGSGSRKRYPCSLRWAKIEIARHWHALSARALMFFQRI